MSEGGEPGAASFAELLRGFRERAGLTQEELAERAGLTPHAVSALERGARTRPYPHTVRALADGLALGDHERDLLVASVPRRRTASAPAVAPADEPAPVAPQPSGLVLPPTVLHGRDRDVDAVVDLVTGGARIVCLTGPGGVGKTRLVGAVADRLAPAFADGVVSVSLAPLVDAAGVVPLLARALGLPAGDGDHAAEVVATALESRRMLLVLDNFEHLLSAVPAVVRVVARCPGVVLLATSRSSLRARGEQEYPVEPLSLPADGTDTADGLGGSAAGALLLERVTAVSSARASSAADLRALTELCHRMAGLPLALELAAAQLRLMSPRTLLDRLDLVVAAPGARDLPDRQRTMRATLDWSYQLLSAEERALFRLLGLFRGGVTLPVLEEVAAASGLVDGDAVLGLLGRLVECSLVVVRDESERITPVPAGPGRRSGEDGYPDEPVRYTQLEPVAQYARSLLSGEETSRGGLAHATYFRGFVEAAAIGYEYADQVEWLDRVERDEANVLLAIGRATDLGDLETAGRIVWAMWLYWWLRGQVHDGRRRAEAVLEHDLPDWLGARVTLSAATMSYAGGDARAAAAHWDRALELSAPTHDDEVHCKATAGVGLAALAAGDLDRAAAQFREGIALAERAGEAGDWLRALAHVWLGTVHLVRGDVATADAEFRRGLAMARDRGDRLITYVALYNLTQASIAAGDTGAARTSLDEGIALSRETGDLSNLAYFLESLAVVEDVEGRHDRVPVLLGAAAALRESVGASVYAYYLPDDVLRQRAEERSRDALGGAAYDEARERGLAMSADATIGYALALGV